MRSATKAYSSCPQRSSATRPYYTFPLHTTASSRQLGAGSLATLLASQACNALTHLDIEGNVIHEQGATALAAGDLPVVLVSPFWWHSSSSYFLCSIWWNAAGLAKISALRFFSMRGNYIGPEGAARSADCTELLLVT
eukprot:1023474-Rhodomonas_salina.3